MNTVIKVENLSKQYRLGLVGSGSMRDDLSRFWARMRGKDDPLTLLGEMNDRETSSKSNYVWSLKDINFDVKQGDIVGIIGRNGAGKSTLLKILSKVTAPTTGYVKMKGKIASLLEVGTGFHPELTGRENIFLNGAILGMRKHEITRKLDEIIAFAGVERYVDTPVKRYSSGMYVRLAFAVAAHLESEILIIDEVLAVGDAEFQKKCLGKMGEVSKSDGRTILFVSHNMAAINTLCNRGVFLEHGNLKVNSSVQQATGYYLHGSERKNKHIKYFDNLYVLPSFTLHEIHIKNSNEDFSDYLNEGHPIELATKISFRENGFDCYHITYHLNNEFGETLFSFSNSDHRDKIKYGENTIKCFFPPYFFQSGTFFLSLYIVVNNRESIFSEKDVFSFTVSDSEREIGSYMGREPGFIRPKFIWKTE